MTDACLAGNLDDALPHESVFDVRGRRPIDRCDESLDHLKWGRLHAVVVVLCHVFPVPCLNRSLEELGPAHEESLRQGSWQNHRKRYQHVPGDKLTNQPQLCDAA